MESKEEEINRRIELLRKKNERLLQRHKEVQEDKKSAERSGQSMLHHSSHYDSPRERSNVGNKQRGPFSRAHMDDTEESYDQHTNYRSRKNQQRERGRGQTNANPVISRRGRGGRHNPVQSYETRRLENFRMMEEEMAQTGDDALKGQSESSPGISRLLDDPRRKGELDPDNRWKSTRHKGSYGGLNFENVKTGMRGGGRTYRGRGRGRGMSRLQVTAEYTGRERQDQARWQVMREAADREIMARSKNAEGGWRREWDAEKGDAGGANQDVRHPKHYSEPRPKGRGRQGSTRRQHDSRDDYTNQNENSGTPEDKSEAGIEKTVQQEETHPAPSSAKPQRVRSKQVKSPGHLLQQRAQTPSSKDGTEVWAQNSHHSDEAGGEWKNGANQSGDQWLPSLEGNSNPAIDERLLEQQEDGATIYSQQLGRGWGSEKNIKATKAWVIDTEKAGVTQDDGNKNIVTDTDIVKANNEYSTSHSASPRLKKKSMGLTVEIDKAGRRVTSQSSQPNVHSIPEVEGKRVGDPQISGATDMLSPDFLKTPEDMKHVVDWATEMDMQSPTYETRQLELSKVSTQQIANQTTDGSNNNPEEHQDLMPSSDHERQQAMSAVKSGKSSPEVAQVNLMNEKLESHSGHAQSTQSSDTCGISESTHPDHGRDEGITDRTGCEEEEKDQLLQTVDKLGSPGSVSAKLKVDGTPETSLEPGVEQQQVKAASNKDEESVQEELMTATVDDSHTNRLDLAVGVGGDMPLELQARQHVLEKVTPDANRYGIPVQNDKLSQATNESDKMAIDPATIRNDASCSVEAKLIDKDKDEGEQFPPDVQRGNITEPNDLKKQVTEIAGSDICDEKDVDCSTPKLEHVKHDPIDIHQNEPKLSQEIDDAEDEFFECDEDRKKETEERDKVHYQKCHSVAARRNLMKIRRRNNASNAGGRAE